MSPSKKVTVPEGFPAAKEAAITLAVNVTDCPDAKELAEEVNVVAVSTCGGFTTIVRTFEVLFLKFASPLYRALIECDPSGKDEVVKVAWPELKDSSPNCMSPSKKVTVPKGFPAPEEAALTLAVNFVD